ncbi:uncharacterized protein RAG0_07174 [Rhynchosporium agropyri]|uniref:Vacuolar protein sorting-associated protein 51 homolog n=1 Tax=Rhynchosporium agropyri TaxID=914238 RepID=A0A1E1KK44_9HELO|nr:uncharacterized protein RAG0_07174 [Rhynchosporium agropyri]
MSTIASPREPSLSGRRIPLISTPTTSSRPSLDTTRSEFSPSRSSHPISQGTTTLPLPPPKRNRAALREYYNLQSQKSGPSSSLSTTTSQPPSSPASSSIHSLADEYGNGDGDENLDSEMDREGFDAEEYVRRVLEEKSLGEVLGIYRGVLADVRALDAERKALVYDNYSKLIVATEMIGRMREGVGNGKGSVSGSGSGSGRNVGGGAVGGKKNEDKVEGVEQLVERVRKGVEALRRDGEGSEARKAEMERAERRRKTRLVVERVSSAPEKVRRLVKDGKKDEASALWEHEKRLLERWRERGVGGPDVGEVIEDGERALRDEDAITRPESDS